MLFLLRCELQRQKLPDKIHRAVDSVLAILNVWPWLPAEYNFVHVAERGAANFQSTDTMVAELVKAARVLIFRHPGIPSVTRWTSMMPGFAYSALWLLLHGLGHQALFTAYDATSTDRESHERFEDDGETDYAALFGRRLSRSFKFWQDPFPDAPPLHHSNSYQ